MNLSKKSITVNQVETAGRGTNNNRLPLFLFYGFIRADQGDKGLITNLHGALPRNKPFNLTFSEKSKK